MGHVCQFGYPTRPAWQPAGQPPPPPPSGGVQPITFFPSSQQSPPPGREGGRVGTPRSICVGTGRKENANCIISIFCIIQDLAFAFFCIFHLPKFSRMIALGDLLYQDTKTFSSCIHHLFRPVLIFQFLHNETDRATMPVRTMIALQFFPCFFLSCCIFFEICAVATPFLKQHFQEKFCKDFKWRLSAVSVT